MRDGIEVVDSDGHIMEPSDLWDKYIDPAYHGVRPRGDTISEGATGLDVLGNVMPRMYADDDGGQFRRGVTEKWRAGRKELIAREWSAEAYIEVMDAEGIDRMVLYPTNGLYAASVHDLPGDVASAICRAYNRWLYDYCSYNGERLIGVALVGLQDPELAAAEARYAAEELGFRGVMIRPNPYMGRNLEDPAYDPFYDEIARLGIALATHEGSGPAMPEYGVDRFKSRLAVHAICHPFEQMAAVYSFTAGGVMERHPDLKVAILEAGGGWLPYWLDRLDEHAEWLENVESETGHLKMMPSEYFRRQGWINCEPTEPGLQAIVEFVGADRVLWASDFPHPDCVYPGTVDNMLQAGKQLAPEDLAKYAGQNAKNLYDI